MVWMRWIIIGGLVAGGPVAGQQADAEPVTPPALTNAAELGRVLAEEAPAQLRQAGLGGTVRLALFVSDTGSVDTVRVASSSGLSVLDAAARRVGRRAKFRPAMVNGTAVSRWVELPLLFPRPVGAAGPELVSVVLENRDSVEASLQAEYPEMLRQAKLGAAVGVALDLDESGQPARATVAQSSCFADLDALAMALALTLPVAPRDTAHTVRRTLLTLSFTRGDTLRLNLMGDADRPPPPRDSTRARPDRRGETRRPVLRNTDAVRRALVANYPEAQRDAGIGGTTTIWFFIDVQGRVQYRTVSQSSGICPLDVAALAIADVMRFRPALSDGEPVEVWVEIPIIFTAR